MPSLIPRSSYEVRPRLAVEIRSEGIVGARSNDATGVLAQIGSATLLPGSIVPSLRAGNIVDRAAVVAALRQVLGALQTGKLRDVSLVLPDAAVRVLLLDFDAVPSNSEDALSVIRFRLTKLLPFSPDAAQVSYQVMGQRARQFQVLAVAIPHEVLSEYESLVREAGFEPGAVLPSTLAVASAIDDSARTASLLVNGGEHVLTTAILRKGELLLHRTLELTSEEAEKEIPVLHGVSAALIDSDAPLEYGADDPSGDDVDEGPIVQEFVELPPEMATREASGAIADRAVGEALQAISVAAAYYEDSLAVPPDTIFTAGTLSSIALSEMVEEAGMGVREVLQPEDVLSTVTIPFSPNLFAGVRGALRS